MAESTKIPHLSPAVQTVGRMAFGLIYSRMLYAAAALGIADRLRDGPRTAAELARETNTHAQSLDRLLRTLVAYGVFSDAGEGRYALNDLAETLCEDAPMSLRKVVLHFGSDACVRTWGEILYSVRTGAPAFEHANGRGLFDYLAERPEEAMLFNHVMSMGTSLSTQEILDNCDFPESAHIVDIGGGNGSLLAAILRSRPQARGTLLECAAGIRSARENDEIAALGERVRLLEGDFFKAVPPDADIYLLKHVLHDWNDERALAILTNCRSAMRPGSRLFIVEVVYERSDPTQRGKLLDLSMLLMTGGRERNEREYRELCARAGLAITRVVPTVGRYSLLEAQCA